MTTAESIKSIGYNQQEIINNILKLYNHARSIEFDPCYNIGGFYRNGIVAGPRIKSDINPTLPGVLKHDVCNLPYKNSFFKSIMFDPPFLISKGASSIMAKRYGSFENAGELKSFYSRALCSLQRVLKHGGLLIVKCQDFVHGRKQHLILPYLYFKARELNFAVRDLFILLAKSRPQNSSIKNQNHARKYHCYFLVLKCNKRTDKRSIV